MSKTHDTSHKGLDERLIDLIEAAGVSPRSVDAAVEIDAVIQNWRRRVQKRELGQRALNDLGLNIDLAQLDVLVAIEGRQNEFGVDEGQETMVASVAERLSIDPSRASRVVSEMVSAGYAVRDVSQEDARRTIIALSPAGKAIVEAVRAYKWMVMGDFLNEWSPKELAAFIPLLHRFSEWTAQLDERAAKFSTHVQALADRIHKEEEKLGEPG